MKKLISCLLIVTIIYVVGFCESGLFENVEKNEAEQSSVGKKPVCCMEVNSWSNDINILKDNIAFGFCAGSPLGASIVVSVLSLIVLLIIGIFEFIFSLGTSQSVLNFTEKSAFPIMIGITAVSTIAGILLNLFYPYYDYAEKTPKKALSNYKVILERAGGCTFSVGLSVLILWLLLKGAGAEAD